jgi:hypothetical protein
MSDSWNQAQESLARLIDQIFEDGRVDDSERQQLRRFWADKGLTVNQVRVVIDRFVDDVWREVVADGIVTDDERSRLRAVVSGLNLPREILPQALLSALAE